VCCVDLRNGWQIISPSKSFTVYAATASEKTEWMAHIEKCAQDLLTKRKLSLSFDDEYRSLRVFITCMWVCCETYKMLVGVSE